MKSTDFALLFIGITLPIIIIVYVNVSFTIKAEEQELYYKKIINTALRDAADQMKEVENSDSEIDYGYSGTENNKVSVNAQVGVDTFLNSLYNNFGIKGNTNAEQYLQYFIPAIAVIDYNGVQVSSVQEYKDKDGNKVIGHVVNPKRHYTYEYSIYTTGDNYKIVEGENSSSKTPDGYILNSTHTIEFTMDDYIIHRGNKKNNSGSFDDIGVKSFYITDSKNNSELIGNYNGSKKDDLTNDVISLLQTRRREVIASTISKEMEYATNNNNYYAGSAGIQYSFTFPGFTNDEMQDQIENVGIVAFVQGISVGNKYLNAKAFSTSKLTNVTRYYLTIPNTSVDPKSKYNMNLYHKDVKCPEYRVADHLNITPSYVFTRQQATSAKAVKKDINYGTKTFEGFYPCPICRP